MTFINKNRIKKFYKRTKHRITGYHYHYHHFRVPGMDTDSSATAVNTATSAGAAASGLSRRSSTDESWSIIDASTTTATGVWTLNYALLEKPRTPHLLDRTSVTAPPSSLSSAVTCGDVIQHQILRNYIVYPGRFDKAGMDTIILFDNALLDKEYKMAFIYVLDATLGYFYDLVEERSRKDFQKEIAIYIFLIHSDDNGTSDKKDMLQVIQGNFLEYIQNYKGIHRIKVVMVTKNNLTPRFTRRLMSCLSFLRSTDLFVSVESRDEESIQENLAPRNIPPEFGGELDGSLMDLWLNQRLQFELFWEDCRNNYERLQFLPSQLKEVSSKVLLESGDKSLQEVIEIYRYEIQPLTFTSHDKDIQVHGRHLLSVFQDGEESNRVDYKTMINAIHSLIRIMTELENYYIELKAVLEGKLGSRWRWAQFKRDVISLQDIVDGVKPLIDGLKNNNVDNQHQYNECYTTMQTVKTVFHELMKRQETLPERRQNRAETNLSELEQVIADCFSELGKNNEKMINTEFVLNIQFDILSWVNDFEADLQLQLNNGEDVLRCLLDKDYRIRSKLENCPCPVIEEYFKTCERIGTDFLLASVLAVETSISELWVSASTVSHHITELTKIKSSQTLQKLKSLAKRLEDVAVYYGNAGEIAGPINWIQRLIGLMSKINDKAEPIELPDIQDLSAFKTRFKETEASSKDLYDDFIMEIENFDADYEIPPSVFVRARALSSKSKSYSSPNNGKESPRSSIRLSFSMKGRKSQESATDRTSWHPPVEVLLGKVEEVVKSLERRGISKKAESYSIDFREARDKKSKKLVRIIQELEETEEAYLTSLTYFKTQILDSGLNNCTSQLQESDREILRKGSALLGEILSTSSTFLEQLKSTNKGPIKVAQIFTSKKQEFYSYEKFINLQSKLEIILTEDHFRVLRTNLKDPLPAETYLTKPMQRLCKYKQLFHDMVANFHSVFTFPQLNQAALQSRKILRKINDQLHLWDEEFSTTELSPFHLYSRVTLIENRQSVGERKAYLFQRSLYLARSKGDYVRYALHHLTLIGYNKPRLEVELAISGPGSIVSSTSTLKRNSSIKKKRDLTLMFQDYLDMTEWIFKFNNIIGNY